MKPPVRFKSFPLYTDPGALNQFCRDMLPRGGGEAANLQMGVCELIGPGSVAEDAHTTWTQYFLVVDGHGTLVLNGESFPLEKDMVVEIPKGTRHFTTCKPGDTLRYFFINLHDT
jgi:quercetin dioxygenase-like cupin family protein